MAINNWLTNIQQLSTNQDGTLKGGFVSITGGRYRIIMGEQDGNDADEIKIKLNFTSNCSCTNDGCENTFCGGSTNINDTDSCTNLVCGGGLVRGNNSTFNSNK